MSGDLHDSGEDSSVYSYKDFAIYAYSSEDEASDTLKQCKMPVTTARRKPRRVSRRRNGSDGKEESDDDDDDDAFWNWTDFNDTGSYIMHEQSDDGNDEFDLYQFSDEDLIPQDPDENWIVGALLSNRRDFNHLELQMKELVDYPRLITALQTNRILKHVTIYESFFESISEQEQITLLADTICRLPNLENLEVYYNSRFFVQPLQRMQPPHLKRLSLMFFPPTQRATQVELNALTKFLRGENSDNSEAEDSGGSSDDSYSQDNSCQNHNLGTITEEAKTLTAININTNPLESLSLRCDVMDDAFIQAIAKGMKYNPTINTLSFWGNNVHVSEVGNRASAVIDFYLRLNQTGIRNMHLLVNATPSEFLDKLEEEQKSLDMVFHLLQTNPSFLSYSTL